MQKEKNTKELKIKNIKGNIEFKNINFGYNANKLIIKDFSAKIKAGQRLP